MFFSQRVFAHCRDFSSISPHGGLWPLALEWIHQQVRIQMFKTPFQECTFCCKLDVRSLIRKQKDPGEVQQFSRCSDVCVCVFLLFLVVSRLSAEQSPIKFLVFRTAVVHRDAPWNTRRKRPGWYMLISHRFNLLAIRKRLVGDASTGNASGLEIEGDESASVPRWSQVGYWDCWNPMKPIGP